MHINWHRVLSFELDHTWIKPNRPASTLGSNPTDPRAHLDQTQQTVSTPHPDQGHVKQIGPSTSMSTTWPNLGPLTIPTKPMLRKNYVDSSPEIPGPDRFLLLKSSAQTQ